MAAYDVEAILSAKDKGYFKTLEQAADAADNLAKNTENVGMSAKSLTVANIAAQALVKTFGIVTGAIGSAIQRLDTLNNFPKVMESLGYSTEQAQESMQKLSDGIEGLPTTMNQIVSNTQTLTATLGDLGQATDTAIALNDMFLAGGQGAEAASRALVQYNQMLAKGKVDMQSWNSVVEVAPGQMSQLAKEMLGASATQRDLYSAIQTGEMSIYDLNDAIIRLDTEGGEGFASFAEQAQSATGGIGTAISNLGTAVTKGLANTIQAMDTSLQENGLPGFAEQLNMLKGVINTVFNGITNAVKGIMSVLGPVFKVLSDNLGRVAVVAGTVVSAIVALKVISGIQSLIKKTADTTKTATESMQKYKDAIEKYGSASNAANKAAESAKKATEMRKKADEAAAKASQLSQKATLLKEKAELAAAKAAEANGANIELNAAAEEAAAAAKKANTASIEAGIVAKEADSLATSAEMMATEEKIAADEADIAHMSIKNILLSEMPLKMKLATIAQKGFNAAVKSNPIGLIVIAITTLISAITALTGAYDAANQELTDEIDYWKDVREQIKDTREEMAKLDQEIKSSDDAYSGKAERVATLQAKIETLAGVEDKSTEQITEMVAAAEELNSIFGDEVVVVDATTGALEGNTAELKKNVKAHLTASRASEAEDQLTEALNAQNENLKQQVELKKWLDDHEAEYNQSKSATYNAGSVQGHYEMIKRQQEYEDNLKTYQELLAQEEEDERRVTEASTKAAEARIENANLEKQAAEEAKQAEIQSAQEKEAAIAQYVFNTNQYMQQMLQNQTLTLDQLTEKNQATVNSLTNTWNKYVDKAHDMFSTLSDESEVGVTDMIAALQKNQQVITDMGNNMATLRQKFSELNLDEAVLDQFSEMGPEAAGYIANLVTASNDELELLANTYAQGGAVAFDSLTAGLGEGADKSAEEIRFMVEGTTESLSQELAKADWLAIGQNVVDSFTETIAAGEDDAEAAGTAIGQGVYDGANSVIRAGSPSKTFTDMGTNVVNSLANGIMSNTTRPIYAIRNMATAMVSACNGLYDKFYYIGYMAITGLVNGINKMYPSLLKASQDVSDVVKKTVEDKLKIGSPSRVFDDIGRFTIEGLVNGINAMQSSVKSAMAGITDSAVSASDFGAISGDVTTRVSYAYAGGNGIYEEIKSLKDAILGQPIQVDATWQTDGRNIAKATATYTRDEVQRIDALDNYRRGIK